MFNNKGEEKQRFSIRKLTIGVTSVLLGISFLTYGTNEVHADVTTENATPATEQVQKNTENNTDKSADKVASDNQAVAVNKDAVEKTTLDSENSQKQDSQVLSDNKQDVKSTTSDIKDQNQAKAENDQKGNLPTDYTDDQIRDAIGLGKNDADISADQLSKLGLKSDEYIKEVNGQPLVYKLDTSLQFWTPNEDQSGNPLKTIKVNLHHNADGTVALPDILMYGFDPNNKIGYALGNFGLTMDIVPVDTGSTIYIQKGHKLDVNDAIRGIKKNGYSSDATLNWDADPSTTVDVNKVGEQTGVVDVTYKSKVGTTVSVPVVVVDLQGSVIYTHQGANIPDAATSISGQPTGSTAAWTTKPSTAQVGTSNGEVEVTYPDGNKGTAQVILHVLAPQGHDTTITLGQPAPTAESIITNHEDLNSNLPGTTYTWEKEPDVSKPGKVNGTVIVTYPDGQSTKVPTVITILDTYKDDTESRQVVRTIIDNVPHETPIKTKQTITFTRTVTRNSSGQITKTSEWKADGVAAWAEYKAKGAEGYTPSTPVVSAQAVTADSKAVTVEINYNANNQKQLINYVDNNDHSHVVFSDAVSGKTDSEVDYQPKAPAGWTIVPGQNLPTKITLSGTPKDPIVIYVQHGTEEAKGQKVVTRTVAFINPYTGVKQIIKVQSTTLHRTGIKDSVTNQVKWGEWDLGSFDVMTAPYFKGYKVVNPNAAAAMIVTGSTKDSEVVFQYEADELTQNINYIDINSGKTIKNDSVKGKSTENVPYTVAVPENWELVPGQNVPTSFTFGFTNPADYNIYIQHGTQNIKDAQTQEVTRNIYQEDPVTKAKKLLTTQTGKISRDGVKDLVTGEITYGPWSTAHLDSYAAPQMEGYYITSSYSAPYVLVIPGVKPADVTFTYAPKWHSQRVNYINKANEKLVFYNDYAGRTGSHFDFTPEIPDGWVISKGQTIPTRFDFTAQDPAPINIYIEHGTTDYPFGTDETVTRAIYANVAGHKIFVKRQSVQLHRTATQDLVTGEISYSQWTTGKLEAVTAPTYEGYEVTNPGAAPAVTVDGSTKKLDDVVFNYKNANQSVNVKYVAKGTSNVIKNDPISGKVGDVVNYTAKAPENWTIVPDQDIPTSITLTSGSMDDIIIYVEHGTKKLADDTKTITRTVLAQDPETGALKQVTVQPATLVRTATQDLVTGNISYGAWSTATWKAVSAPEIAGYTCDNANAAAEKTVSGNDEDTKVIFTYSANDQSTTVSFVDNANHSNVLRTDTVKGKSNTTVSYNGQVPTGWVLVKGQNIPTSIKFTANGAEPVVVYVEHGKQALDDESRIITRTVSVKNPVNGSVELIKTQNGKISRTVTKDLVTNQLSYGAWSTATWDAVTALEFAGYTVVNGDAAGFVTVTDKTQNTNVIFTYTANNQAFNVNYVDVDTNATVKSDNVKGQTGETVNYTVAVPEGYQLVKGQNIPSSFQFTGKQMKDVTILVKQDANRLYDISANDQVVTHVGANEQSPSLDPSKINLTWKDKKGNVVTAPAGTKLTWQSAPSTTSETKEAENAKLVVTFADGTTSVVDVPVMVKAAHAQEVAPVDQGAAVPAASNFVNIDDIKQFDFKDVTWVKEPSTAEANAAAPGVARVNYQDGTYQDVDVTLDVRKVEDGRDHKDQKDLYMFSYGWIMQRNPDGTFARRSVKKYYYKIRTTDLKTGDVTVTNWLLDKIENA